MESQDIQIADDTQYRTAVQMLGQKSRPSWLLRQLMGALEHYRQQRKLGWSRPQNKQGLTVFASYALRTEPDRELIEAVFATYAAELAARTSEREIEFLQELSRSPNLMGFVFVHDLIEDGARFEGITFSLGRKAERRPRHRDRFDLILDCAVTQGRSQGMSRLRGYVDPYLPGARGSAAPRVCQAPATPAARALFERGIDLHRAWSGQPDRSFRHWTSEYIDYFGPRTSAVAGSFFPTPVVFQSVAS